MEKQKQTPEVGMGATYGIGSDSYAYTIVEVSENKRTVKVQADEAKAQEGSDYYGDQKYDYTPNPKARIRTFTLRKSGRYYEKGCEMGRGGSLTIGFRRTYRDPSF